MALIDALILWIHLLATSIWVGGSILIGVVISPYLKSLNMNSKERLITMVTLGRRFNRIAFPSLIILFATGVYNARFYIYAPENLFSSYGIILIIKIVITIVMSLTYIIHVKVLWNKLENKLNDYDENMINKFRGRIINVGRLTVILSIIILLLASILDLGL